MGRWEPSVRPIPRWLGARGCRDTCRTVVVVVVMVGGTYRQGDYRFTTPTIVKSAGRQRSSLTSHRVTSLFIALWSSTCPRNSRLVCLIFHVNRTYMFKTSFFPLYFIVVEFSLKCKAFFSLLDQMGFCLREAGRRVVRTLASEPRGTLIGSSWDTKNPPTPVDPAVVTGAWLYRKLRRGTRNGSCPRKKLCNSSPCSPWEVEDRVLAPCPLLITGQMIKRTGV